MKLSEYEIRVVLRMHKRGASVRGLARDLGVTVPAGRTRDCPQLRADSSPPRRVSTFRIP